MSKTWAFTVGRGWIEALLTYGLIGALLAPIFGRVGGVFVAFLLPFLDIGITQSPMLHPIPTTFARLLPGYGGSRVLLDGALTRGFDETKPLLVALSWLVVLLLVVAFTYRRAIAPAGRAFAHAEHGRSAVDGVLSDNIRAGTMSSGAGWAFCRAIPPGPSR